MSFTVCHYLEVYGGHLAGLSWHRDTLENHVGVVAQVLHCLHEYRVFFLSFKHSGQTFPKHLNQKVPTHDKVLLSTTCCREYIQLIIYLSPKRCPFKIDNLLYQQGTKCWEKIHSNFCYTKLILCSNSCNLYIYTICRAISK